MRIIFLLIFLACAGLIGYALYLQLMDGLLPCPLCIFQRIAYWLIGITALFTFIHNPQSLGRHIYCGLIISFSLAGAIVAGRQAWLIRFPEAFECGISPEEAFLNGLPLAQWWPNMFEANGDCNDGAWQFLSLTLPDWSLLIFAAFGIIAGLLWHKKYNSINQ
ncbi:Thiol:disulfide interchange protein DsbB [Nitrosomonas eutropha]|uniref:disulfide bond formation protein B n=1 Tax=Nitrosomonas eutropha TaxID=916 RepID=UPI000886D5A9|nr:disulfide bond formation protein B [Nitrosomonas eutropha]SCX00517.1 Thiol:disulfide interchange protein DsbB [Nitrosomonas eutropha]